MENVTIDPRNLDRLCLQEKLAAENGFALAAPVFALGTPVVELGRENFRRSRQEFEALPTAKEVFRPFLSRVAAELRKDVEVKVTDLEMTPSGRLHRLSGGSASPAIYLAHPKALRQLLDRTACDEPAAAATYLATIPADRRAAEVNHWFRGADEEKSLVLRTRLSLADVETSASTSGVAGLAPYGREVYAVVSDRYALGAEVDVLGQMLLEALADGVFPGDARGSVAYDGKRATISALWHSDIQPESVCAGEVFKAGVNISAQDDTGLSITVDGSLLRNLCLNLIILALAKKEFAKIRHTGDRGKLLTAVYAAITEASKSVAGFAKLWDAGRATKLDSAVRDIPAAYLIDGVHVAAQHEIDVVKGAVRGLLKSGRLSVPGFRGEAAVDALAKTYEREPEFTKVGLVNAITRHAHEANQSKLWATEDLEENAGTILANPRPFDFVEEGQVF